MSGTFQHATSPSTRGSTSKRRDVPSSPAGSPTRPSGSASDNVARRSTRVAVGKHQAHDDIQSDADLGDEFLPAEEAQTRLDDDVIKIKQACSRSGAVQQDVKTAWRSIIQTYCRQPNDYNFPKWALETLGEELVLVCLRAEFPTSTLEALWRRRCPTLCKQMADWLGLCNPEMLALWFGADETRGPSEKSVSKIITATCRVRDIPTTPDDFRNKTYPRILRNWANRLGYKLDKPFSRRRCILARLPYRDFKNPVTSMKIKAKRCRISPADFGFLPQSLDMEGNQGEADYLSEDSQEQDAGQLHRPFSISQKLNTSTPVIPRQHHQPSLSSTTSSASFSRPIVFEDSGVSSDTSSVIPPSVFSARDIDRSSQAHSPFTPIDGSSVDVMSPSIATFKRRADASPGMPVAKRLHLAPESDRCSRRTTISCSPDVDANMEPPVFQPQEDDPSIPHQLATPASRAFPSIGEAELQRLRGGLCDEHEEDLGGSWLNDNIVNGFCEMLAFSSPAFTTMSGLLPFEKSPTHPAIRQSLVDPSSDQYFDNLVVCANVSQSHWVTILFNMPKRAIAVLDSLSPVPPSPSPRLKNVDKVISRLMPLLPEEMLQHSIAYPPCPRQEDSHNCGIFALAYLWYSISGTPMPETLDGQLWRRLFLALAEQRNLVATLPDEVKEVVTGKVPLLPSRSLEQHHNDNRTLSTDPLNLADDLARRAKLIAESCHAEYNKCVEEAGRILDWIGEVEPTLAILSTSAAAEQQRVGAILAQMENELEGVELVRQALRTSPLASSRARLAQVEDLQRHLKLSMHSQSVRHGRAQVASKLFGILDVAGARRELENTVEGYHRLVLRAQKRMES